MPNFLQAHWPICFCLCEPINKSPSSLGCPAGTHKKSAKLCSKPTHSTWLQCWEPEHSYLFPHYSLSERNNFIWVLYSNKSYKPKFPYETLKNANSSNTQINLILTAIRYMKGEKHVLRPTDLLLREHWRE